ncbi:MAG: hypothetical protein JWO12_2695 [Frankiales bacterium]|nr:hypothetical protein [Frankiales bacterium]
MRVVTSSLEAARVLRDAGVEVVLVGADITQAQLEATAVQEDAEVVRTPEDAARFLED